MASSTNHKSSLINCRRFVSANCVQRSSFANHYYSSSSSSSIIRNVIIVLVLYPLLLLVTIPSSTTVNCEEILDTLDNLICLRSNGFFPHDVRCDHFYECRNSTIINEGICKSGLRFDYRYRKKPRCIASDIIDCRVTRIDVPSSIPVTTQSPVFNPFTTTTSKPTTTTPTSITTTTSRPRPTTRSLPTTTNDFPFTNLFPTTETPWSPHLRSRTVKLTTTRPPTTVRPNIFITTTTTRTPNVSSNTRTNSQSNRSRSLQKLSDNSDKSIDEIDFDNALTKKRKLIRKPVKLRRGHLQESSASSFIAPGGNNDGNGNTNHQHHQHHQHQHHRQPQHNNHNPHLTEDDQSPNSLLSRSVSSDFSSILPSRPKSIHCATSHGYFADREDCRKFYACDDGRAFAMSCPLGLAYDELTGTCNWPDMVEGCRGEEMLRFTCPDPYENDILDYGDPRYPTSDCRKFVVCVLSDLYGSRTPRLLGCEEGLVFNPESKSCDYPENVPKCANYYDTNPSALAENKFRRAQLSLPKKRRARH